MNTELKWTISGVVFLIVFTLGCYLWYHWETEPYRQDYAKTQQLVQEWTAPLNTMETVQVLDDVEIQAVDPAEQKSVSAVKSPDQTDTGVENKSLHNPNVVEPDPIVTVKEVRVSPFGFGAYPEIPEGFPEPDIFDSLESMGTSDMRKALELQKRLIVEFYRQGKSLENIGVVGDADGRVYLNYPDVVYVSWDYWTDEDGMTHKYAGVSRGHPEALHTSKRYLDAGKIPPGITVYELPDGYIDAYEVLGLDR